MKKFLTGVLILSSIVMLFGSCSSLRRQGYRRVSAENYQFIPVFGPGFDKSLYTAEITFGKNIFTSLAVIKQIPEYNSFRLAFLSEVGIRLFEMEFLNDGNVRVHYMSDFLNKKSIVKKLSSDFNLLFTGETANSITMAYSMVGDTGNYLLRAKEDGLKDFYYTSTTGGPVKIRDGGCAFGKTTVFLNQYENGGPNEILFTHKMLKLKISLKQITDPEWN